LRPNGLDIDLPDEQARLVLGQLRSDEMVIFDANGAERAELCQNAVEAVPVFANFSQFPPISANPLPNFANSRQPVANFRRSPPVRASFSLVVFK
jgi:hypothetical protein